MTTSYTLTGDFASLLGGSVKAPKHVKVTLSTNLGDVALVDLDANEVRLSGTTRVDLTDDLTFSLSLIATNSTGTNVTDGTLRYKVDAIYRDANNRERTWTSGYFTLTADADLSDKAGGAGDLDVTVAPSPSLIDSPQAANINSSTSATRTALNSLIEGKIGAETAAPAAVPNAFIANGEGNAISMFVERDTDPRRSHAEGWNNRAYEWENHAEGSSCIVDGKIAHVEGNTSICTANDSHAEGNRTVAGRREYRSGITYGSEDAGDGLGVLEFVLIPDDEGDVSSFFPNPLTDNITTRYGDGAQKDAKGNIYGPTTTGTWTPAVWDGDTVVTPNDLRWAMHSWCIVRGTAETAIAFVSIAKATYAGGVGTKVYYRGARPFPDLIGIYSSYSPVVLGGGNGQHAEGLVTSTWNYGSHAEGHLTRAWGYAAHSEGRETQATGNYSHSQGYQSKATGRASHAEGEGNTASGQWSRAEGRGAVARRDAQQAYSAGKRVAAGDNQVTRISYNRSCDSALGWHPITLLADVTADGTYHFEAMIVGRQTSGSGGAVGNSFAYRFTGAFTVAGGVMTVLGTITRTLVGRTAGMTGDGLSTGARLSAYTSLYTPGNSLIVRFDPEADTVTYISSHTTIQELLA